ncbi:MAG TPA: hypothetical protein VLN26_04475 [Gaiellaceae bacterium]|nr:hypothetical protein [Gaiellaceae bacterium]
MAPRALAAALLAGLAFAGTARATTIRVAVTSLDDPEIGWSLWQHAVPDLCGPLDELGPRHWRLACREAAAVADALRRPGVTARVRGRSVDVTTAFAWRRFPDFLKRLAVPGAKRFPAVRAGPRRIVGIRPGLRLEFVRMEPHAAAAAFARGEVDVAPVPLGDIRAALADPRLRASVRLRPLDAVDAVVLPSVLPPALRRTYWSTANRADYALLASDGIGRPAFGFLPGSPEPSATDYREAKSRIRTLVQPRVRVAGDPEPASIVVADWRDLGLGAVVDRSGTARFERLTALYPGAEGLFLALQPRPGPLLREALAARDPAAALGRLDARLRRTATVVPLARAVGARLVSPRLAGWRQDALGLADYRAVTKR